MDGLARAGGGAWVDTHRIRRDRRLRRARISLGRRRDALILWRARCASRDPRNVFVCAVADPRAKLAITTALRARQARFANVIDPTALVAPDATLGTGVYLARLATVSIHARVGDDCAINMHATVGHHAVVGDGCTISSHADITGRVVLGRGVMRASCCHPAAWEGRGLRGRRRGQRRAAVPRAETSVFGVPARAL